MDDAVRDLRDFLAHMGIVAEVRLDFVSNKLLIAIETERYHQRRDFIDAWFILVDEVAPYSYFHPRPRGTGDTR